MLRSKIVQPDAARVIEGLRDTGYQFNTAVADVVDNSVAAEASLIEILLELDFRGHVSLRIYDDGVGMDEEELLLAMQYGSPKRKSKASLGKFGLGLKTASTAFCRRLAVVSRKTGKAPLNMAVWDLDHVSTKHQWELLEGPAEPEEKAIFEQKLSGKRGTLVLWQKADRVIKEYSKANGAAAQRAFKKLVDGLRQHLGMVFQRFIDLDDSRVDRHVKITLNGAPVEMWNPFRPDISTIAAKEELTVKLGDGSETKFLIRAFVLPRKESVSSDEWKAAQVSTDNQGIYIYRENRMMHGPDWLGLLSKEPHRNLLRVEFSFEHTLDEAFQVDIKKSQVILDPSLADFVKQFLGPPIRVAEETYRRGRKQDVADLSKNAHADSNRNISAMEGEVKGPTVKSLDAKTGTATIVNSQGQVRLKMTITTAEKKDEVHVKAVDSLDDGVLWEPAFIDGHCAVLLNRGHPFYSKVYMPNVEHLEGVTVVGLDSFIWALSLAELNCVSDPTKVMFTDMRYEVSRNLKKLVEGLPEPKLGEE
jgi:hypothetical protein